MKGRGGQLRNCGISKKVCLQTTYSLENVPKNIFGWNWYAHFLNFTSTKKVYSKTRTFLIAHSNERVRTAEDHSLQEALCHCVKHLSSVQSTAFQKNLFDIAFDLITESKTHVSAFMIMAKEIHALMKVSVSTFRIVRNLKDWLLHQHTVPSYESKYLNLTLKGKAFILLHLWKTPSRSAVVGRSIYSERVVERSLNDRYLLPHYF